MTTPTRPDSQDRSTGADDADATSEPSAERTSIALADEPASPQETTDLVDRRPPASPSGAATESSVVEEVAPASTEEKPRASSRPLQALVDLLHDLAIAAVVCVLLITYVVQAFKVQGTSMAPELGDGERILVNKFLYYFDDIERGDVVVFWYPDDPDLSFIKRVIGLPGETVEIRNGVVHIDGEELSELYVVAGNQDLGNHPPLTVRPGHYFVLGDNRKGSNDSRSWGLVPERYIYGKAFFRLWPLDEIGTVD